MPSSKHLLSPETRRRLLGARTSTTTSYTSEPHRPTGHQPIQHQHHRSHQCSSTLLSSSAESPHTKSFSAHASGSTPSRTAVVTTDAAFYSTQADEYKRISQKYRAVIDILTRKIESLQQNGSPRNNSPVRELFCSPSDVRGSRQHSPFQHGASGGTNAATDWKEWEAHGFELMVKLSHMSCDLSFEKCKIFDAFRAQMFGVALSSLESVRRECLQLASDLDHWMPNREW